MKLIKNEKGLIFGAFLLSMLITSPLIIGAIEQAINEKEPVEKEKNHCEVEKPQKKIKVKKCEQGE